MFRNVQQGIQKILAAVVVLALAMPSNLFAARPTASRNTPSVTQKMERDLTLRAEIRTIDDVERDSLMMAKQLDRTSLREVLKPHLSTKDLTTGDLNTAESIIEAAYDRIWTNISPASRPQLDKVFALAIVLHSDQPVNPADPRPYLVKPAGVILNMINELALLDQPEDDILKIISYALLHRAYENPIEGGAGLKLYQTSKDEEAVRKQIATLIGAFSSDEVLALIQSGRKPADYNPEDADSVEKYYTTLLTKDSKIQLVELAEIAQDLRDQELYLQELRARVGIVPVVLKPVLRLVSESPVDIAAKRGFLGVIWRALAAHENSVRYGRITKPYIIFSPDDEEKLPQFEQRFKGSVPAIVPAVKEWARELAKNDHVLSIDLPSLSDLNDGLLDQLIRDGLIYSATTNNNGNLKYLREIQANARGKRPNPVLAEAIRILRKNPAISRKDAVAQAYENLINNFVARLAVKLYPIYLKSGGRHGFISTELPTAIVIAEGDSRTFEKRVQAIVEAGIKRFEETQGAIAAINNGVPTRNILLKIPATDLGLEAGKRLEALGYNVNYTLVATEKQYRDTVLAHKEGLISFVTKYAATHEGQVPPLTLLPQSVSSDFVSRDDRNVAKLIDEKAFDKTLPLLITHIEAQIKLVESPASPEAQRLQTIREKLLRVQALSPAEAADNVERQEILSAFAVIRGTGPEGTTAAGLAFAQANIIDIWTAEFVNDQTWKEFLAKYYGATTPEKITEINKILSQQIYWASTGVKIGNDYTTNPFYLAGLVVPNTTNTVPRDVLEAIARGETVPFEVRAVSETDKAGARKILKTLSAIGINLDLIKREVILPEGLKDFNGSDLASYDILRDAVEIAALINKVLEGEAELLETNVSFTNLPSVLEGILSSREVAQVFVQGQLVQASIPAAVPGIAAPPVAGTLPSLLVVGANPNAAAPAVNVVNPDLPAGMDTVGNLPAKITSPASTSNLTGPALSQPIDAGRLTKVGQPTDVGQPVNAEPLRQPDTSRGIVPELGALPPVQNLPSVSGPQAAPFTEPGQQAPVERPEIPQATAPQIPAAVNLPAVNRIPLITAEVLRIIPQINKSKKDEHQQLDFVLTFEPEQNILRVNFIRSEFRPDAEDVKRETGVQETQSQPEEARTRAEVRRYLNTAQSQLSQLAVPVIPNAPTVRRAALAPFSANFDENNIFDPDFTFRLGGLAVIPTLTAKNRQSVVILDEDPRTAVKQEAFVEAFNDRAGLKNSQRILVAHSVAEAVEILRHRSDDPNVVMRAFVGSLGDGAETLKKQFERAKVAVSVVTMKGFDQMVPRGSRLAAFVTVIRDQFIAFSKAV